MSTYENYKGEECKCYERLIVSTMVDHYIIFLFEIVIVNIRLTGKSLTNNQISKSHRTTYSVPWAFHYSFLVCFILRRYQWLQLAYKVYFRDDWVPIKCTRIINECMISDRLVHDPLVLGQLISAWSGTDLSKLMEETWLDISMYLFMQWNDDGFNSHSLFYYHDLMTANICTRHPL